MVGGLGLSPVSIRAPSRAELQPSRIDQTPACCLRIASNYASSSSGLFAHASKQRLPLRHGGRSGRGKRVPAFVATMAPPRPPVDPDLSKSSGEPSVGMAEALRAEPEEEKSSQEEAFVWKDHWYPVSLIEDLDPSVPTPFQLLGRELVIWKDPQGEWRVFLDKCPHRLAPLSVSLVTHFGLHEIESAVTRLIFRSLKLALIFGVGHGLDYGRRGGWTSLGCCSALTMDGRSRATAAAVRFRRQRQQGRKRKPNSLLVLVRCRTRRKSRRACCSCGRMRRVGRRLRKPHLPCEQILSQLFFMKVLICQLCTVFKFRAWKSTDGLEIG